jgi:hypothetical protein
MEETGEAQDAREVRYVVGFVVPSEMFLRGGEIFERNIAID